MHRPSVPEDELALLRQKRQQAPTEGPSVFEESGDVVVDLPDLPVFSMSPETARELGLRLILTSTKILSERY